MTCRVLFYILLVKIIFSFPLSCGDPCFSLPGRPFGVENRVFVGAPAGAWSLCVNGIHPLGHAGSQALQHPECQESEA